MSDLLKQIAGLTAEQRMALRTKIARKKAQMNRIPVRQDQTSYPLSFAQERLWLIRQLDSGPQYNDYSAYRLTGELNLPALERALSEVVARHEVLRSVIATVEGAPVQSIVSAGPVSIPVVSAETWSAEDVRTFQVEQLRFSFNFASGPLFHVVLLRHASAEHTLILVLHHIVTDGWSFGVLVRELATLYDAFAAQTTPSLPKLPIQYADYAAWQRAKLESGAFDKQLGYWKNRLQALKPVRFPSENHSPAASARGARYHFSLSPELTQSLRSFSQAHGVTTFMTTLAAYLVLLGRYSDTSDIGVGSVVAGRNQQEVEGLIGNFVNTIVFRANLSANPAFAEFVSCVREFTLEAFDNQEVPFDKVVQELRPARELAGTPLVSAMFGFQVPGITTYKGFTGLEFSAIDADNEESPFQFSLQLFDGKENIFARCLYRSELYDAAAVTRICRHFERLLQIFISHPAQRVLDPPLLTDDERRQILLEWNCTEAEYRANFCVHQLFEQQAKCAPQAIALRFEGQELTYAEVNERANRLAHYLQAKGAGPEVLAGIFLDRSLEMVVAVLAVLKAGSAYVPLDPEYPPARLSFIMEDARIPLLVTRNSLLEKAPRDAATVVVDRDRAVIEGCCAEATQTPVSSTNLAYVIYTSGSTGRPKGAAMQHQGVANLVTAVGQGLGLKPDCRVLQFASLSFDAAVWEIFPALSCGATLVLARSESLVPGDPLLRTLQQEHINVVTLPPSALANLPAAQLPDLRTLVVAGEACPDVLIRDWGHDRTMINAYGPTEVTVCASWASPALASAAACIGRPISNTRLYVLDQNQNPVPIATPGELYIAGAGLSRGYLNQPGLTAEKFIPNPFSDSGARLYRSGDRARYRSDGTLEFLGRMDQQVKIRGYRIELGEIESALHAHPGVQQAAVAVKGAADGQRLVAYVVSRTGAAVNAADLRNHLKQRLPEYMVPSAVVGLNELPLNATGKVSREALPEPVAPERGSAEPETPTQIALAEIWREILNMENIGIHDNFFELGGHSLLAARMISRANRAFAVEIPLAALFRNAHIASLSEVIEELVLAEIEAISDEQAAKLASTQQQQ